MAKDQHAAFDPETDNHPTSGKCGCVWKHASEIRKSQWSTHPCHYPTQGVKSARTHRARLEGDHRGRAVAMGYLVQDGNGYRLDSDVVGKHARGKAPERQRRKEERREKFDRAAFIQRFVTERAEQPLSLLVREADGWYVDHPHPDARTNPKLAGVKTFTLRERPGHPGQRYPYFHEHHHIIPADALNKYVLNHDGDGAKRDARVKVLLKGKWNLNDEENMIVLPSEVVPARIVGLPAHCPWDEADHPSYTESLKAWLVRARRDVDAALKVEKHEVIAQAGERLSKVSGELRKVIEQERGGKKLSRLRAPKGGEG